MSTLLRIFDGIALMILGFITARVGCMVLVGGLYERSVFSIVPGILGIAMVAGGIYLFVKGWQWISERGRQRPIPFSNKASSYPQTSLS
jgi:hypothetical protein